MSGAGRGPGRRGRWPRPAVPGEDPGPVPVADAVAAVAGSLGMGDVRAVTVITERWAEIVGEAVASHSRVRTLRDGILTLAVERGPWATQLRYLADDVRDRVGAIVGAGVVRDVRVVVEAGS